MDENIYIGLANVFRHGALFADQVGIRIPYLAWNGTHWVSQYPPGMPALIALFSFMGWNFIFLIGPLFLLIGFAFFVRWLRSEGLPVGYAWLYLYYPAFLFYSRTVMSEIPCMAFVTVACCEFSRKRFLTAGFLIGIAANFRNPAALILIAMIATCWLEHRAKSSISLTFPPACKLLLGALPPIGLILLYNALTTGHLFRFPYELTTGQPLRIAHVVPNFVRFGESLMVVYPGMLLSVLWAAPRRGGLPLAAFGIFTLFHALVPPSWITSNQWEDLGQRLVLQHRFLLPALPCLLFLFIRMLDGLFQSVRIAVNRFLLLALPLLVIAAGFLHVRHQNHLIKLAAFQEIIYARIPEEAIVWTNYDGLKLLNDAHGRRSWKLLSSPGQWLRQTEIGPVFYLEVVHYGSPRSGGTSFPPASSGFTLLERRERGSSVLSIYHRPAI